MKKETRRWMVWWLVVGMAGMVLALTGCESDHNDETMEEIQAEATNSVNNADSPGDEDHGLNEFFYDGLHPTRWQQSLPACCQEDQALDDTGSNNVSVIVCR